MKLIKISEVIGNKDNPRIIKDQKFKSLVKSIKEFPEMLKLRPIVVNEDMIVLGGNMRLKACKEAGLKDVWVIKAVGLSKKKQQEFIVKDNVSAGQWDWDILGNEWEPINLNDWGLDVWVPEEQKDFEPKYTPLSDHKELTDNDFENSGQYKDRVTGIRKEFINCTCPNCFTEFKIEANV